MRVFSILSYSILVCLFVFRLSSFGITKTLYAVLNIRRNYYESNVKDKINGVELRRHTAKIKTGFFEVEMSCILKAFK